MIISRAITLFLWSLHLHIAYYSPSWPPGSDANGIVTYVNHMRQELIRRGHRISVFTSGQIFKPEGPIEFAEVRSLGERLRSRAENLETRFTRSLRSHGYKLARRLAPYTEDIDIIEMEESFGWCRAVGEVIKRPLITRLHGPTFLSSSDNLGLLAAREYRRRMKDEGWGIRGSPVITSPSKRVLADTLCHYGACPKITGVVPNPAYIDDAHDPWRLSGCDRQRILWVGRFDRAKGADLILEAFARFSTEHPSSRLVMAGPDTGLAVSNREVLTFRQYSARYLTPAIRNRIDFVGLCTPQRISELRRECFLTVVCSRLENFPYSVLEAMAAGSPLVITAGYGDGDMVKHRSTGWVVRAEQPHSIAAAMREAFANPTEAAQFGAAGRARCYEVYSPERVGEQMEALYTRVLYNRA